MLDVRALRSRPRLTLLTALCLAAVFSAGCGGDDAAGGRKLPRATAASLQASLDQIEQDVGTRDCSTAGEQAGKLRQQVEALSNVSRSLRRALLASVERLQSLVEDECQAAAAPPVEAQPPTGATGPTGEQGKGKKKGKKEKPPKDEEPSPDEQVPPGLQDGGGGAGLPGESTTDEGR